MPDMVETSGIMKEAIKKTALNRLSVLSMKKGSDVHDPSSSLNIGPGNNIDSLVRDVTRQVIRKMGTK